MNKRNRIFTAGGSILAIAVALLFSGPLRAGEDDAKAEKAVKALGGKAIRGEEEGPIIILNLQNTKVTDTDLKGLAQLLDLQYVNLNGTKVTDAGLMELVARVVGKVQYLNLSGTQVTDAGMVGTAGWPSLQKLDLSGTQVTGKGLMVRYPLSRPLSLKSLNLSRTKVTDADLKELNGLTSLQSLNLSGTLVTGKGPWKLDEPADDPRSKFPRKVEGKGPKGLPNLQSLNLSGAKVTDGGLNGLAELPSLQFLDLSGAKVTYAGLKGLAPLTSLQSLNLSGAQVTDASLMGLAGQATLQKLDVSGTQVTDVGITELQKVLPRLKIIR